MQFTQEVQDYINAHEGEQLAFYQKLQDIIDGICPKAEVKLNWRIAVYYHGKLWVGLGFRKDGISFYTMHIPLISAFKEKHPHLKYGKGCINFRLKDEIPVEDIKTLIRKVLSLKPL